MHFREFSPRKRAISESASRPLPPQKSQKSWASRTHRTSPWNQSLLDLLIVSSPQSVSNVDDFGLAPTVANAGMNDPYSPLASFAINTFVVSNSDRVQPVFIGVEEISTVTTQPEDQSPFTVLAPGEFVRVSQGTSSVRSGRLDGCKELKPSFLGVVRALDGRLGLASSNRF